MTENQQERNDSDATLAREVENFYLSYPEIASIQASTVRGTRLRFPEANQAAPSFVPEHPVNRTFTKNYTGHADLIDVLESRGLTVADHQNAINWLRKVGYYRLTGYGLPIHPSPSNPWDSQQIGNPAYCVFLPRITDRHVPFPPPTH